MTGKGENLLFLHGHRPFDFGRCTPPIQVAYLSAAKRDGPTICDRAPACIPGANFRGDLSAFNLHRYRTGSDS